MKEEPLPFDKLLERARHYCDYRERSEQELYKKMQDIGASESDTELILHQMRRERYVDNERFASAYTRGKFRQNKWGRIKIRQGLKLKGIDSTMAQRALAELDEESYRACLTSLIEAKKPAKKSLTRKEKDKIMRYAYSKGYEQALIFDVLDEMTS